MEIPELDRASGGDGTAAGFPDTSMNHPNESPSHATSDQGRIMNYHFPVEVVVVGALEEEDIERISSYIMTQLDDALARIE